MPAPPYRSNALLGDHANAMAMYRDVAQRWSQPPNLLASPTSLGLLGAFAPKYPSQPKFDDWRREASWIETAGNVDAPDA